LYVWVRILKVQIRVGEFVEIHIGLRDLWTSLWSFRYANFGRIRGGLDTGSMDEFGELLIKDLYCNKAFSNEAVD